MPAKEVLKRARQDKHEGKAPSTQAGEFVREEIEHIREGKHGARSAKQAIAIGLSKARRAGVKLGTPKKGAVSKERVAAKARRPPNARAQLSVRSSVKATARPQNLHSRDRHTKRQLNAQRRRARAPPKRPRRPARSNIHGRREATIALKMSGRFA